MKQLTALQQQGRRSNSFRSALSPLDAATVDGSVKSPAAIFWLVLHGLCCLISLVLGFRFSRLVFFLLFSTSSSPSTTTVYTALRTTLASSAVTSPPERNISAGERASRVVVGRHGILIRPWPHPDPSEVMQAHTIIERVQSEQKSQYGVKSPKTVIAITPTYVRTFQTLHLTGVMHSLMNVPYDLIWIVVEADGVTNETASLISKSGLKTIHIGFEGKMPVLWEDRHKLESKMRLHALRVVREKRLDGIVMFADDSNMHNLELFNEIQKVKWIGAISVGILVHWGGPACNSSNHFVGWHTFNPLPYVERSAKYIGDSAVVLPKKLEWAGFVLNSRLVWEDTEKPVWVKELEEVGGDGEDVESPMSLLKDSSVVEPLGSCGRKVMLWWLRVEARADSKFPARYILGPFNRAHCEDLMDNRPSFRYYCPCQTHPMAGHSSRPPSSVEQVTSIQENTDRHATKNRSRGKRSSRSKKKHTPKVLLDEHVSTLDLRDN
ncbi:hypothetical protein DH2020_037547 [Rehmannia glutinosa]|uniref:Glycosyltransferases n=1 Tax=Rehmannia glutinosa TaxID=99300 RepID=A0ABR0V3L2_REHGL